jgi:hypothetical protein
VHANSTTGLEGGARLFSSGVATLYTPSTTPPCVENRKGGRKIQQQPRLSRLPSLSGRDSRKPYCIEHSWLREKHRVPAAQASPSTVGFARTQPCRFRRTRPTTNPLPAGCDVTRCWRRHYKSKFAKGGGESEGCAIRFLQNCRTPPSILGMVADAQHGAEVPLMTRPCRLGESAQPVFLFRLDSALGPCWNLGGRLARVGPSFETMERLDSGPSRYSVEFNIKLHLPVKMTEMALSSTVRRYGVSFLCTSVLPRNQQACTSENKQATWNSFPSSRLRRRRAPGSMQRSRGEEEARSETCT